MYKGRCNEFDTNVRGPRAPRVEFSDVLHKICQNVKGYNPYCKGEWTIKSYQIHSM